MVFDIVCQGIARARRPRERGGILVAVARARTPFVTGDDREWRDAARGSCAEHGVDLLGAWIATRMEIRPIPDDDADAGEANREQSA